jgi:hypothetical protein
MKSKIRIRKAECDLVYVMKTDKFITEEEVADIRSKQEKSRQHRSKQNKK